MNSQEFYSQLVQAQYSPLYLYAMSILHDSYLAEDLVMDTFHTAFLKIEVVQAHENPAGWLIQVLRNKIGNYLRHIRAGSWPTVSLDDQETPLELPDTTQLPLGGDTHLLLLAIQEVLSPEDYQLLRLYYVDNWQHAQLAEKFGITVWACRKRLQRICQKLRDEFPEEYQKKK